MDSGGLLCDKSLVCFDKSTPTIEGATPTIGGSDAYNWGEGMIYLRGKKWDVAKIGRIG
jgi:hypothetical protein